MSERTELQGEATWMMDASRKVPSPASHSDFSGQNEPKNQNPLAAECDGGTPIALIHEIDGRMMRENPHVDAVNMRGKARRSVDTIRPLPSPAPNSSFDGRIANENHCAFAIEGSASNGASTLHASQNKWLAEQCERLRYLQRQRQFCITSQSRCDRSCESFIARMIGYDPEADEKSRKEVFKQASNFRKKVEKGEVGKGQALDKNQLSRALSDCIPIVMNSAIARQAWDGLRASTEKDMRKIAQSLPAYAWVKDVRGFGDLGFAIIIGETGDLANYATKERVWKRLGLAVIEGQRQGRRTNAEEAAKHGYSPKRRAEIWTVTDSLFRAQWRGAKEDAPAHALGLYGTAYARRKAATEGRPDWTPAHRDNDARRIMCKFLVENLWRVWNRKEALRLDGVQE